MKFYQFTFNAARKGYHEGPSREMLSLEAEDTQEAYQAFKQEAEKEYPSQEWDIWEVSHTERGLMGRPSQGRTARLQAAITPEQMDWLEEQKVQHGDKSVSDVVFRLIQESEIKQMAEINPNQYSITVYPYVDMPIVIDRFVSTREEALERLAKWCDAEKYSNVSLRDDRGYVVKEWAADPQTQKEINALRDMHREYKATQS